MRYVGSKPLKRLEEYRVKGASKEHQRTLLLPVSCGVSSVTLLHLLDQQLQNQVVRTGRTGFILHVLLVDTSREEDDAPNTGQLEILKERYPRHTYTALTLGDVFEYRLDSAEGVLDLLPQGDSKGIPASDSNQARLQEFLSSLPSATSRSDVLGVLRTRLIVAFAKAKGCESILWGDSTTRLAEKTLAETAKGRGFSLPWRTGEGASPYGVYCNYPLRDLLKKELLTFSELTLPPLTSLIMKRTSSTQVSASAKNTTIDDLMSQYFESVELNYPSIVANVVRTASKLGAPQSPSRDMDCGLCGLPILDGKGGIYSWAGNQRSETEPSTPWSADPLTTPELCYGCARTMHGAKANGTTLPS